MGLYARLVVPRLINLGMRQEGVTARRAVMIPRARGRVLEIGIGSGMNLPFYGPAVTRVDGIDPSPELLRQAEARARAASFPVVLHEGSAEELSLASHSIDTAVMTWTLCSVRSPPDTLRELRRVLVPSGVLIFAEHGLSPEPAIARWQHRLDPVWHRIAGGCHLSRTTDDLIRAAGFDIRELATGYLPGPRVAAWGTFIYQGQATPA
ncbi:MAG TPA: class I SAM-dependent methyltransferase [Vicinamibacteria bacterium]|jgi:ubiquinone/menaquinone biosynthesis C-methylase UbiE